MVVCKSINKNFKGTIGEVAALLRQTAKHQMHIILYIEQMLHSIVKIPTDLLPEIVTSTPPPVNAVAEGEKSAQPLTDTKVKSPFDISDDEEDISDTPINEAGSSHFTPTPPISRADKGKGISSSSIESAMKMIMPLIDQGGSKKKRIMEVAKHAFLKADVIVDGMERNLVPYMGVTTSKHGHVIEQHEAGIMFYNGNMDLGPLLSC
nr:hypothetical protein [Tanacetum cinerariifolium]